MTTAVTPLLTDEEAARTELVVVCGIETHPPRVYRMWVEAVISYWTARNENDRFHSRPILPTCPCVNCGLLAVKKARKDALKDQLDRVEMLRADHAKGGDLG